MQVSAQSRGLLVGLDETAIKARLKTPPYQALWSQMADAWRAAAEQSAKTKGVFGYGSLGWYSISPMAIEAAMLYRWGGDAAALEYVRDRAEHLARVAADESLHATLPIKKHPIHSNWELALAADLCRDALAGHTLDRLMHAFRTQAIDYHRGTQPFKYYAPGANIPFVQTVTAGIVALVWGADCGHPDWQRVVDIARDACIMNLRYGYDKNGYPYEGTGYGYETVFHIYLYAQLLHQTGRDDLFASEPVLSRIPPSAMNVMFPDRTGMINTNDHGLCLPWSMPWLLLTSRYYRRPADLALWNEFQGPDHPIRPFGFSVPWLEKTYPEHPQLGNQNYHVATHAMTLLWWDAADRPSTIAAAGAPLSDYAHGVEAMNCRTSWSRDAIYLNVQGSGRTHGAFGHSHADCGHFSIFAHGEYLAIDTGRYNVDEDQHNVVLVEGKCHMPCKDWGWNPRYGRLVQFQQRPWLDYAMADAAAMKNCIWADRHVLFVRMGGDDAYVVTIDNVNPDSTFHNYWWQLHTRAACRIELRPELAQASIVAPKARLDAHFFMPRAEDFPTAKTTFELRTDTKDWNLNEPAENSACMRSELMISSARRPRLVAQWGGPHMLMTVMAPRRAGEPRLVMRSTPVERAFHVDIDRPDGVDTIIAALDHGYLDLPGVRGFCELTVIRRNASGQVDDVWTVNGSQLRILS